ncbi:MAG TPA: MBL fold metallo-hydrolase [Solirubrobacterales bacterium]|nr:MBL fold metallo-hydrolase [Solirubrobacterales bacterium]
MSAPDPDKAPNLVAVAAGVKRVSVGEPFQSHVYLLEGHEGPVAFDAGVKGTGTAILAAAGAPLQRVVLSHAHVDHRGAANELAAPVHCHPDEVADAEGDAGRSYTDYDRIENDSVREALPRLHAAWDGGPVEIAGTISDGEEINGFRVIHIPGHAPGQIALFRESDRLLLAADAVFTFDAETGQPGSARVPHPFSNWQTAIARESIRRLAELEPSSAWTAHSEPLTGPDVAEQLRRAATAA